MRIRILLILTLIACCALQAAAAPKTMPVRDMMWVWGITEIEDGTNPPISEYTKAGPMERARLLGVPNIAMGGLGVKLDYQKSVQLTEAISSAPKVLWEVTADRDIHKPDPDFLYPRTMSVIRRLADRFTNIEGVVLDDMSSVGIDKGFKPEHIRNVRRLLPGRYNRQVKLWGVVYTMNMVRPNIGDYIKELDGMIFCVWHAKEIPEFEANILRVQKQYPDQPMILCLYMYDYGQVRRMPQELMEQQCETALKLAKEGKIRGMLFVSITDDEEMIKWTADWVKKVGDTPVPVVD
ncbi:MAG: hypothetical protein Q7T05_08840 [Dehalococcoidia bacterium]|nr:hypothetical protein [Dehalococcoidia bacterium]